LLVRKVVDNDADDLVLQVLVALVSCGNDGSRSVPAFDGLVEQSKWENTSIRIYHVVMNVYLPFLSFSVFYPNSLRRLALAVELLIDSFLLTVIKRFATRHCILCTWGLGRRGGY